MGHQGRGQDRSRRQGVSLLCELWSDEAAVLGGGQDLNEDTFLKSIFFCFPFPIMMSWPPTLPTADNTPVVIIFVRSGRFLFASKYLAHNDNVGSLSLPSPPNAALWCPPTAQPEPFPSLLLAAAAAPPLPDAAGLLARPRSRERTATGRAQEERQRAGDSILAR